MFSILSWYVFTDTTSTYVGPDNKDADDGRRGAGEENNGMDSDINLDFLTKSPPLAKRFSFRPHCNVVKVFGALCFRWGENTFTSENMAHNGDDLDLLTCQHGRLLQTTVSNLFFQGES